MYQTKCKKHGEFLWSDRERKPVCPVCAGEVPPPGDPDLEEKT